MDMYLVRNKFTDKSIIGRFYLPGFKCYSLEPAGKEIPVGRYKVVLDWSNRFGRIMPHILNVPNREGIRIHWGNWPINSDGCMLTGQSRGEDVVWNSKAAFSDLMEELRKYDDTTLHIINNPNEGEW